jgi:phosphoribosylanthranilate isomerase
MTKVKICGITNLEDALLAEGFGADALGFNFYEKSPRYISSERAGQINGELSKEILKVGVFVNESLENILSIAEIAKLNAVQLHGDETPEFIDEFRTSSDVQILKALRVTPSFQYEDVHAYGADAILLDTYSPEERGGTGESFDWKIASAVSKTFDRLYLAGGLNSNNVLEAVASVRPYAVDVCSGVESTRGRKDPAKLEEFIRNAKSA